jgi:hypothetical protein
MIKGTRLGKREMIKREALRNINHMRPPIIKMAKRILLAKV